MGERLRILVVGPDRDEAEALAVAIRAHGYGAVLARDAWEALSEAARAAPDLVFMDLALPHGEMLETIRRLRALAGERWVPLVLTVAMEALRDVPKGLDAAADDYLLKPAPAAAVGAKIRSLLRLRGVQAQALACAAELAAGREDAAEQDRLGHFVISRLVDRERLCDPALRWHSLPARGFSGDLICANRGPGDVLCLLLADAAGHGLAAALSALPLPQVFYSMSAKGFPVRSIAEELNRKLRALLPIDRFVAATLVAADLRNRTVEVWNGGNPPALLIADSGAVERRWPSRHPPLGILPADRFSGVPEVFNYRRAGDLVLCSDGVIEAAGEDGRCLGVEGLETTLCAAPPGERGSALASAVHSRLGGNQPHDDVSWLVARLAPRPQPRHVPRQTAAVVEEPVSEWRLRLRWGAAELRCVDVVPAVMRLVGEVTALKPHLGPLHLVVSELFNNALDHGLLRLDSRVKRQDGGFERYLAERQRGFGALRHGHIDIALHLQTMRLGPVLDISVADSGEGFDFSGLFDEHGGIADPKRAYGRGIDLVCKLCREVRYSGKGNRVRARYVL